MGFWVLFNFTRSVFHGFVEVDIEIAYQKKQLLRESGDLDLFQVFEASEARHFRRVNRQRITHFWRSWHLAPAKLNRQTRQASLEDLRAKDFIEKVYQSIQKVALMMDLIAAFRSSASNEDKMTSVLFKFSKDRIPANFITWQLRERAFTNSSPSNQ